MSAIVYAIAMCTNIGSCSISADLALDRGQCVEMAARFNRNAGSGNPWRCVAMRVPAWAEVR